MNPQHVLEGLVDEENVGLAAAAIANLAAKMQDSSQATIARHLFRSAQDLFKLAEDPYQSARCQLDLGRIEVAAGRYGLARRYLTAARKRFVAMGTPKEVAGCDEALGDVADAEGRFTDALELYGSAHEVYDALGMGPASTWCQYQIGRMLRLCDRAGEAYALLSEARDTYRSHAVTNQVADCELEMAFAALGMGSLDVAVQHARNSRVLFDAAGDDEQVETCDHLLAQANYEAAMDEMEIEWHWTSWGGQNDGHR